mmetsp:Transcript_149186/g.415809  ORF Transcript_149186/g.415809 Transcript_149186/m.415809 type:complete len:239 (+) Transcript_149186:1367-2083(+)
MSSKPSSLSGSEKLVKECASSFEVRSWTRGLRNQSACSCSESSTAGGAALAASAESPSSLAASAEPPLPSCSSFFASPLLVSFSGSFPFSTLLPASSAAAFLRTPGGGGGGCLARTAASRSAWCRLSSSASRRTRALCSSGGSPMTTSAILLNSASSKLASILRRSVAIRLFRTSMTTQLRFSTGTTDRIIFWMVSSSSSRMPKSMWGRSLQVRDVPPWRRSPLLTPHSRIARLLISV